MERHLQYACAVDMEHMLQFHSRACIDHVSSRPPLALRIYNMHVQWTWSGGGAGSGGGPGGAGAAAAGAVDAGVADSARDASAKRRRTFTWEQS